ncbi:hypothetical protein [Gracilibacillus sp. HCP3S3_G5_2]|uniref:hypothetical protein n=1 Tax=Gracilibacillus sp. HCP3S3_G5_2 TaxID=3438941 RepID=UPI003F8B7BD3
MVLPLNVLVVAVKSIPFAWGNAFYYASEGSERVSEWHHMNKYSFMKGCRYIMYKVANINYIIETESYIEEHKNKDAHQGV